MRYLKNGTVDGKERKKIKEIQFLFHFSITVNVINNRKLVTMRRDESMSKYESVIHLL